jgi:hypothetical protein
MEVSQDNFTAEINSSMLSWDSSEDTVQATGMGSELRTTRMSDAHEMLPELDSRSDDMYAALA